MFKRSFERKIRHHFENGEWEMVHALFAEQMKEDGPWKNKLMPERWRFMYEESERNYELGLSKILTSLNLVNQALDTFDYAKAHQELKIAQREMNQYKIRSMEGEIDIHKKNLKGRDIILEMATNLQNISVADIAKECDLSSWSVKQIITGMLDRGEIKGRYIDGTEAFITNPQENLELGVEGKKEAPPAPITANTVIIRRQYEYLGGKVRVRVSIENTQSTGLFAVTAALDIPPSFKLLRVEPLDYEREGASVEINDLLSQEKKSVSWILEPLVCGKEHLPGSVNGVDTDNKPFSVPISSLEIEVRCPLFVQPEDANLPTVQRMVEDLPVNDSRVFLLPDNLVPNDAYDVARHAIATHDVLYVGEVDGEQGGSFDKSAWFFGVTKTGHKRFVLSAAVSEADRAIRLTTACDEEATCTGFLAEAGATVRRELVLRGAVDSEEGVRELVCEKCGMTLPWAPVIGRDVQCPDCGVTWRVQDFYL